MICNRNLIVFVIFREWGPGTSVTGYVWPTTNIFLISRKKYFVSPLMVFLDVTSQLGYVDHHMLPTSQPENPLDMVCDETGVLLLDCCREPVLFDQD